MMIAFSQQEIIDVCAELCRRGTYPSYTAVTGAGISCGEGRFIKIRDAAIADQSLLLPRGVKRRKHTLPAHDWGNSANRKESRGSVSFDQMTTRQQRRVCVARERTISRYAANLRVKMVHDALTEAPDVSLV